MPTSTQTVGSPAAVAALKKLDKATKPIPTSNRTDRKHVAGAAVSALERRGLAKRDKEGAALITARGRKALAKAV